jgi:alkylated DNA repair dioxygenase AlkB
MAHRQVVSFGYRYDYGDRRLHEAAPIPDFLKPLIQKAAGFAGHAPEDFVHVLINEYRPGAGIGWHRDKAHFGDVVGISLGAPCTLRFRLSSGEKWIRRNVPLAARSAYLLTGPARQAWEHSIAPLAAHRYSITLRTLAG